MEINKLKNPLIRIPPYYYIHVLNLNTHLTDLHIGPKTYVCQEDERVVLGPEKMITVSKMKYCVIENPVVRDSNGNVIYDEYNRTKIRLGDVEYRFAQDPFPLYPSEKLLNKVQDLPLVEANTALRLKAVMDFEADGVKHTACEEWLFKGRGIYYPRKEVQVVKTISAVIIKINQALVLKALNNFVDRKGISRIQGEQWLWKVFGAFIPDVFEEIVEVRSALKLKENKAIWLRSIRSHTDEFGILRKFGDEWLIRHEDTDAYILGVDETLCQFRSKTIVKDNEYCVIVNPRDQEGVVHYGELKMVRGPASFYLHCDEYIQDDSIQRAYLIRDNKGLILEANLTVEDVADRTGAKVIRKPGEKWLLRGPMEYFPPLGVTVISKRSTIALDINEGIYVQNIQTGDVRSVIGQSYMLNHEEVLWKKQLPKEVIELLKANKDPLADRGKRSGGDSSDEFDLTRVVTFRVPHNSAVQIYDYENKKSRVEFGPTLVMLGPDEQFTRLSLSGGKPKKPNTIKSLCLLLGPDFCTDVIVVETSDHARLSLKLSYNWVFDVPSPCSEADAAKLFSVPDFIGDACKTIASRIRGTVASVQFDDFHKHSSRIIRAPFFGLDENDKIGPSYKFEHNNLVITNIDVQSVEPVDQRTRDLLQKSVQLAIEISTSSQEAAARHEAERLEQEAQGRLEKDKMNNEFGVEEARHSLLEMKLDLAEMECTSQAKAEALSRAQGALIEAQADVERAKFRSECIRIETRAELDRLECVRQAELDYLKRKDALNDKMLIQTMRMEVEHFKMMVNAIGSATLKAMATAESENQLKMLKSLGLRSALITDGSTPVNLLSTAHGLIGAALPSNEA